MWEWVRINTAMPLWRRSKSEITEEEVRNCARKLGRIAALIHASTTSST